MNGALDLFNPQYVQGDDFPPLGVENPIRNFQFGNAGQLLVLADLKIRGYEAAELEGVNGDVIANISGRWRLFQVKSKIEGNHFAPGGRRYVTSNGSACKQRSLASYIGSVDAMAFVHLGKRMPYYMFPEALGESAGITINSFSAQLRDRSFDELLRRWGASA